MKTIASICVLCVLCRGMIVAAPNAPSPLATPGPSTNATAQLPRRIVGIPDYNQTNGFVSAKRAMTETLLAAGLVPVVIPEMDDTSADLVLANCDAVLIGGSVTEEDYARRRAFEDRILKLAEKRGLVVIGICHGCQIINRHFGGTITSVPKGSELVHKNAALLKRTGSMAEHLAIVPPGDSLMSRTFGEGQVMVNSSHKFRCEKIASGFRVTATSEEDGVVEAIEHETLPIFGFQFHPEYYWRKDPRFMDLIRNAFAPREADAKR